MWQQECYDRGETSCTAVDNRCILEYSPDSETPACVPNVGFEDRPDPLLVERVLTQIIEPENVANPNALDQRMQELIAELMPIVDTRIRGLTSREHSSAWLGIVADVSRDMIAGVGVPDTPPPTQLRLQMQGHAVQRRIQIEQQEQASLSFQEILVISCCAMVLLAVMRGTGVGIAEMVEDVIKETLKKAALRSVGKVGRSPLYRSAYKKAGTLANRIRPSGVRGAG